MFISLFSAILLGLNIFFGDTSGTNSGNGAKFKWELSFEDNFDSLDRSKWIFHHDNGVRTIWSNKELQWYLDDNVSVEGGVLKLTTRKQSVYGKDPESEKQFDFTSGMICNSKSFTQAFGKWEMKVKFPFRKGFWPAFFLVPIQRPTLPEIDIFEYFGIDRNSIQCALHWGIDYPNPSMGSDPKPLYNLKTHAFGGDFENRWMVWACEVMPDRIVWLLDGKKVYESTEGIPTAPLYMIANVAIKDWEANNYEVDRTDNPYVMEIDYVRIYRIVPSGN